jgi:hypothetical protein
MYWRRIIWFLVTFGSSRTRVKLWNRWPRGSRIHPSLARSRRLRPKRGWIQVLSMRRAITDIRGRARPRRTTTLVSDFRSNRNLTRRSSGRASAKLRSTTITWVLRTSLYSPRLNKTLVLWCSRVQLKSKCHNRTNHLDNNPAILQTGRHNPNLSTRTHTAKPIQINSRRPR